MPKTVNPQQIKVVQTFQIFYSYCRTSVLCRRRETSAFHWLQCRSGLSPTDWEREENVYSGTSWWEVVGSQWVKEVAKKSTVLHQKPRAMTLFATVACILHGRHRLIRKHLQAARCSVAVKLWKVWCNFYFEGKRSPLPIWVWFFFFLWAAAVIKLRKEIFVASFLSGNVHFSFGAQRLSTNFTD